MQYVDELRKRILNKNNHKLNINPKKKLKKRKPQAPICLHLSSLHVSKTNFIEKYNSIGEGALKVAKGLLVVVLHVR